MRDIGGILFLGLFGLLWCSFVFFFDGLLARDAIRQIRASSYATTPGAIKHAVIKVDRDSDGSSYSPDVEYQYEVNGRPYLGKRVRYDSAGLGSWGEKHVQAIVNKYSAEKNVTVHYDAANPEEAVLELGLDPANLAVLLFLVPFNAVGLGFVAGVFVWIRSLQLRRPILGVYFRNDVLGQTIRLYEISPALVALGAGGGMGFVSVFGFLLLSMLIPIPVAIGIGWIATIAAAVFAYRYARGKYTEIRRDTLRSRIELRALDGLRYSIAQEDLQPVTYSLRVKKDSDGDRVERFPLTLPFFDPASNCHHSLPLPEQTSESDAEQFVKWLNGVLEIEVTK